MFSFSDIVDFAVQIEHNGEKIYRSAQQKGADPALCALLQWLADEELKHAAWFSELKGTVDAAMDDPQLAKMGRSLLRDVLADQSFSLKDIDFSRVEQVQTLLLLIVEFEKDTIIFYEMLQSFIKDKAVLGQINTIVEEERRHVQELEAYVSRGESPPVSH
ncbi:MAG: ferritin family protein [Desulfobacterales bacterium]|nr:ferritin family protein [Desulfobacterales bacterium]